MLQIKNVHKTFNPGTINEKKALNGVDLVLNEGDFVTVIGGNGAGKSTMLNMIAGVYPVDCGTITVDGIDVDGVVAGPRVDGELGRRGEGRGLDGDDVVAAAGLEQDAASEDLPAEVDVVVAVAEPGSIAHNKL